MSPPKPTHGARSWLRDLLALDGAAFTAEPSPWRHRPALLALIPIALFVLAVMVWAPWYSNMNVDSMTFSEQVRAVAFGGSVGFENGPVERFAELRTRWFVGAHGRAWGIYPPIISYILAPAMRLGGFRGMIRAIWAFFGLSALMTYALTYRLTRRPAVAVGAAYAMAFSSSLAMWGIAGTPFIPCAALGVSAVYLSHRAMANSGWRSFGFALGAGVLGSCALGSHLLWAGPWAVGGAALVLHGRLSERLARPIAYAVGSAPFLAVMSSINHQRFGVWSPISYGPCDSTTCTPVAPNDQTLEAFLGLLKPVRWYVAAFALCVYFARKSPRAVGLVCLFAGLGAVVPDTELAHRFLMLIRTTWGYVIDVGSLDIALPRGSERLGSFNLEWPFCAKSLLQCSPVFAAAALLGDRHRHARSEAHDGVTALTLLGSCLALLFLVTLRANTGSFNPWGYPLVNFRYAAPLIPLVTVMAAMVLASLPWRVIHPLIALGCGLYGMVWFSRQVSDEDLLRRQVIHWLPLALGLATLVAAAAAERAEGLSRPLLRHLAAVLVMACLGYGAAVEGGIDRVVATHWRGPQTERTLELARCTPRSFILLGGYAMDEALALHDTREIYFINVGMGPRDGSNARGLVDAAMRPDRPAFLIEDYEQGPWNFNWPGFTFRTRPECPRVREIVRVP